MMNCYDYYVVATGLPVPVIHADSYPDTDEYKDSTTGNYSLYTQGGNHL